MASAKQRGADAAYDITRVEGAWRVSIGGFGWTFATWPEACEHAMETARLYATVSGKCTCVRVTDPGGGFLEVRRFAGVVRLPSAFRRLPAVGERRA
jgi:hypothetical protein